MPARLAAEIYRVVNAAVEDATDLGTNPLDFIVLKPDAVRITTRHKRHSTSTTDGKEHEFWTEFYVKNGLICAQDGRSNDVDTREGQEHQYEVLDIMINLSDIFESAKRLAATLSSYL